MANSSAEPVEYDLSEWPEDARVDLGWMLRGRDIPYDLNPDGTLVVPEARSSEVDAFLEYLSAVPDDVDDTVDADWRVAAASATTKGIHNAFFMWLTPCLNDGHEWFGFSADKGDGSKRLLPAPALINHDATDARSLL